MKIEKVLILDGVDKVCEEKLKDAGIEVTTLAKFCGEDHNLLKTHDGLIVRSATKVTKGLLEGASCLKVIGRAGTGVDNIDVDAASRKGIIVMNTPAGNTISAAEHTCGMICALSRSLPQACSSLKAGLWDRKKFMGSELFGKTLAIIGLGRIGREVAHRMQAFGMRIVGYDPIYPEESARRLGIDFMDLEAIWPIADYITVHTPLMVSTRNLINGSVLGSCKKNVKLINVARGGIIDEVALLKALENGTCGGAALDVYDEEPPTDLSLIKHSKVICTPHLGANTAEAQKRVAEEIADQFVDMSLGRNLNGVVNAPSFAVADQKRAALWVQLASSLARLAYQLADGEGATHLSIELGADSPDFKELLIPAALMGVIFEIQQNDDVNLINAPLLAKEMKVKLTASLAHVSVPIRPDYLKVICTRGQRISAVAGAIVGETVALFKIGDHIWPVGVTLTQNLIFYRSSSSVPAIGAIVLSLQTSLMDILSSTECDTERLLAIRTKEPVKNLPSTKEAKLLAQISFKK